MSTPAYRKLKNGDILFLNKIPEVFDGYEQDKEHKNTWHPLWEPCRFRVEKLFRCPQGRMHLTTMCDLKDRVVSYTYCDSCFDLEPPLVQIDLGQ